MGLADELSFRNLPAEEGGPRTPLRQFKGKLEKFADSVDDYQRNIITFYFTDVEVLKSEEPYDFPIAEIANG